MRAPTFIGIGMQKCATRWLYHQLRGHPAFRMPPVKEFHFFDAPFPARKHLGPPGRRATRQPWDAPFLARLRALERRDDHPLETYLSLFAGTEGHLTGEITPSYVGLSEATVDRIAEAMPDTRIVLMLRDPVSRLWSALNDRVNAGRLDPACLVDPARTLALLETAPLNAVSYPGRAYRNWSRRHEVLCWFLEDVIADPAGVRRRVLVALGADPDVAGGIPVEQNAKAGRPRAPMPGAIRDALAEHFAEDMALAARLIGGRARDWPGRYR